MTWDARYQEAAATLENRDAAIAKAAADIESDLDLVGSTAIEDKLQEGVPAAIQSLLDAGIKVKPLPGWTGRLNLLGCTVRQQQPCSMSVDQDAQALICAWNLSLPEMIWDRVVYA